jgi:hypothetical protein
MVALSGYVFVIIVAVVVVLDSGLTNLRKMPS